MTVPVEDVATIGPTAFISSLLRRRRLCGGAGADGGSVGVDGAAAFDAVRVTVAAAVAEAGGVGGNTSVAALPGLLCVMEATSRSSILSRKK